MIKTFLLISFLLIASKTIHAQENIDSLKNSLIHLNAASRTTERDSLQGEIYRELLQHYNESQPDSVIFFGREWLQRARELKNIPQQERALFGIAYGFYNLGNYPQALECALQMNAMASKDADSSEIYGSYGFMGAIYGKQGEFRKAIKYLTMTKGYGERTKHNETLQLMYTHVGHAYYNVDMLDSALWFENRAMDLAEKRQGGLNLILVYRGDIYARMGKQELALNDYRGSIFHSQNQPKLLSTVYLSLARLYFQMKMLDSTIFYGTSAAEIAAQGSFLYFSADAYSLLTDAYKSMRNTDSTFKYLNLMTAAKDSLYSRERLQQMEFLVFNQELRKKEMATETLAYKNKLKIYSLLGGLFTLLLISIILLRNNKAKQQSNQLLKLEKDKVESTLTELQSTQAQLIQSEKMASLGELTAGIAHEIQNPLNFVNNFSDLNTELIEELQDEIKNGKYESVSAIADDIKTNEQKISQHGKRAEAIVKGMLQHSRSDAGVKEPTDLNALADEYLRLAYHGLRAKDNSFNATLKTDYDDTIGKIQIIPQDIGRVLLNLITNAFYAVTQKLKTENAHPGFEKYEPVVSIKTTQANGSVHIEVTDNGNGIPEKIVDKIFQPFFTTKPTGQGTGLGLSLAYDIVKAHGGQLKVETKVDEGTTFIIQLPVL